MEELGQDKEFELLLLQKQHKEMMQAMAAMIEAVSKGLTMPEVKVDTTGIEAVLATLNHHADESVPKAIKAMETVLAKKVEQLIKKTEEVKKQETPKEWVFTITRDKNDKLKTINAKSK